MQVMPPGSTGGPSRLFILRPVATTLLMVAILLAGIIGYRFLPVSALPEVSPVVLVLLKLNVPVAPLTNVSVTASAELVRLRIGRVEPTVKAGFTGFQYPVWLAAPPKRIDG